MGNDKNYEILMRKNDTKENIEKESDSKHSKNVFWIFAVIVVFLITIFVFIFMGNRNAKPDDVSQETYDLAVYMIKVVDLYLNGEESLEDIYKKVKSINVDIDYDSDYSKDRTVLTTIRCLQMEVSTMETKTVLGKSDASGFSDIKKYRDELAKKINYKD